MKVEATYTVKGYMCSFKDVVDVESDTDENIREALNQIVDETFHDERAVVRDVLVVKHVG